MRVRVLGNAGRYLAPLSGGSGYLLEGGGARVLLDCGGGVRDALARLGIRRVDAVVLSHFHHDHVLDFVAVGSLVPDGTPVFVPPGEGARLEALAHGYVFRGKWEMPGLVAVEFGKTHRVGELALSFAPTQHSAPSIGTRIEAPNGATMVYASDSAPCAPLGEIAREADLLLMHTLLPTVEEGSEHERIHSTAATASAFAAEVRARRLLLSHRYHESRDEDMLRAAAGARRVELARDDDVHEVVRE